MFNTAGSQLAHTHIQASLEVPQEFIKKEKTK